MTASCDAHWNIQLPFIHHVIQVKSDTTAKKRVVLLDGEVIRRRDLVAKMSGEENFLIHGCMVCINVKALDSSTYEYSLTVDGTMFQNLGPEPSKKFQIWEGKDDAKFLRIVLDKNAMKVFENGEEVETEYSFMDGGSVMKFSVGKSNCRIEGTHSGKRSTGMIYKLYVNELEFTCK